MFDNRDPLERSDMTDKRIQSVTGRLKEAAGSLSGDRGLKSRGKAEQAAASAKDAIDKVAETAKRLLAERKSRQP